MDNINTFAEYWQENHEPKARVLFLSDLKTWRDVQRIYTTHGVSRISLSKLIQENSWIPDPEEVFERIKKAECESQPKAVLVTGLHAYFALIDGKVRKHLVGLLGKWLSTPHVAECAILLLQDEDIVKMFEELDAYPRFLQGRQCIFFAVAENEEKFNLQKEIRIVNKQWQHLLPRQGMLLSKYLELQEQLPCIEDSYSIIMDTSSIRLAILHSNVEHVLSIREVVRLFYNNFDNNELSEAALEWVCSRLQESTERALIEELNTHLLPGRDVCRDVLHQFEKFDGVERELLLWLARRRAPETSYLSYVLNSYDFDAENFFRSYIAGFLEVGERKDWVAERFEAIRLAGFHKFRPEFSYVVKLARDKATEYLIDWFCGTKEEKIDLIRRCQNEPMIPEALLGVYFELKAYLADCDFGTAELNNYFLRYRYAFISNKLDQEFFDLAKQIEIPLFVESRDALLQRYSSQKDCALLVVDAMGAEWMPMLLEYAKKNRIGVEWCGICKAKEPTITEVNSIFWPKERFLSNIKHIDNIGHNGLESHVVHSPEENLVELLEVMDKNIMIRVQEGLSLYRRVIVTADHGSSRLAVLASQTSPPLARTIKIEALAAPESVRYCKKSSAGQCPDGLQETVDGQYWVVRGYDRISKKGGLGFTVHGGATLEELLVPFVVFSCDVPLNVGGNKVEAPTKKAQIIEDPDFDL